MKKIKQSLLFIFFFSLPYFSLAWGPLGHRIVGEIAASYLTPKARAAIQKILGTESVAIASTWADFIRSDSSYNYLSNWHYVNLDKGLTHDQVVAYLESDTATDVYTKMNMLVTELKNKTLSPAKKQFDLRLLIHLVGDLHQPMHAGRKEDLGGNRVKILWFNNPSNMHSLWDEGLIIYQQLSYTEYTVAINHTTLQERLQWQKEAPAQWIAESYDIAEGLYNEITEKDQKLGYDYNFRHIATLNDRLLKAGVRLAGLLNSIFG